jgi:hypothetical protein
MNTWDPTANDDTILAFLFVSGTDARILSLDQLLDSTWYGQPIREGELIADGERANAHHGAIVICGEEINDSDPMDVIAAWLQQHCETISSLDGAKTLELQSFIPPDMGSKFLVIPTELI